jgi:hypothetical protein
MEEGWLRTTGQLVWKFIEDARAAIVGLVVVAAIAWMASHLGENVKAPAWALALGAGAVVGVFGLLAWQFQKHSRVHSRIVELASLDESLLALFPSFVRDANREAAIKRLLYETLRDATRLLGEQVSRASILRENDQRQLVPWVVYQMGNEPGQSRFSTEPGPDRNRGVAGETYQDRTLRVVHMVKYQGRWHAEIFKAANGK